jgi:prevent-host-death family protein
MGTVAIFEAKSRLSEILAAVEHGEEFTVTKRGEPIARIVPFRQAPSDDAIAKRRAMIDRLRAARDAAPVDDFDLRAAIEEGRD